MHNSEEMCVERAVLLLRRRKARGPRAVHLPLLWVVRLWRWCLAAWGPNVKRTARFIPFRRPVTPGLWTSYRWHACSSVTFSYIFVTSFILTLYFVSRGVCSPP
jgi:hypothetical protein